MKLRIKNNHNLIIIVNCCASHFELMKNKPEDTEIFYENLDKLVNKYKNKSIYSYSSRWHACSSREKDETQHILKVLDFMMIENQ